MRNLASIKVISDIQPIEGKDRVVLATVDGWSVVVQKDQFSVGDQVVYIEIDSVLPEKPEFEFLRSKKFRIKTMRLGSVISQGICFPLSILPSGFYEPDQDVTDLIGVKQYEPTMDIDPETPAAKPSRKYPKCLMRMKWFRNLVLPKKCDCSFPSFISKTDETRIQNVPFILKENDTWTATEKVDGSSATYALVRKKSRIPFFKDRFEFIVCSRNKRLPVPDSSFYWRIAEKFHIEKALMDMMKDFKSLDYDWIAIQGECVGTKIQGNKYKLRDYDLYVFNLITPEKRLPSLSAKKIIEDHGMKFVPIVDECVVLDKDVDAILKYAHGNSLIGNTLREGIVFRSLDGRISFKAVDPMFLLKHDE